MPLASEVTTWQEPSEANEDGAPAPRLRSRVRTNVEPEPFRRRLDSLGLLDLAERIERYEAGWNWSGTGHGYEILWREPTSFADLLSLARL